MDGDYEYNLTLFEDHCVLNEESTFKVLPVFYYVLFALGLIGTFREKEE